MTAYMTGVKVDNGVLSQTADTRAYDEAVRPQADHGETACASVGNGKPVTTLLPSFAKWSRTRHRHRHDGPRHAGDRRRAS